MSQNIGARIWNRGDHLALLVSIEGPKLAPTVSGTTIESIGLTLMQERGLTGEWVVDVRLVNIKTMRQLNLEAQGHDEPTDVLSFPIHFATDRTDPHELIPNEGPQLLGSIVISPEVATKQAPAHHRTTDQEIEWLVEHAFHHLLGEDHDDEGHWLPRSSTGAIEPA